MSELLRAIGDLANWIDGNVNDPLKRDEAKLILERIDAALDKLDPKDSE